LDQLQHDIFMNLENNLGFQYKSTDTSNRTFVDHLDPRLPQARIKNILHSEIYKYLITGFEQHNDRLRYCSADLKAEIPQFTGL